MTARLVCARREQVLKGGGQAADKNLQPCFMALGSKCLS